MLKKCVDATPEQALGYAGTVDKAGRTLLKQTTQSECKDVQAKVSEETKHETRFQKEKKFVAKPIKTLIIDVRLIGLQEMAIALLRWTNW